MGNLVEKSSDKLNGTEHAELVNSMKTLTAALTRHSEICQQNNIKMERLTLALSRLDSVLRKGTGLETSGPSLQLKQGIAEFVRFYINPQFYHTNELGLPVHRSREHERDQLTTNNSGG